MTKKATPDQIAAEWIARLDRRQLTAEEDRLLQNWIREDVRHKGAFLRCQAIWHATNRAQALRSPAADWSQRRQLPSRRMVVSTAAAAFFCAIFVPSGTTEAKIFYETHRNILHTPEKWRRKLILDCHTKVEDSSCDTRVISGLCYVTACDELVKTANLRFIVNGSLLVSQGQNHESGVVINGSAHVWRRSISDPKCLTTGTRITVTSRGTLRFSHLDKDELVRLLAWTTGQIALETETISEAADIFNRYNQKQIISSFRLGDQRLSGLFDLNRPDIFVQAARSIAGARVREDAHHFYLE
ncbi:DUF4880 domain-containing protein [Acetobacter fabarum]|uniref:FecR family protein n=2 Tax=Acetobacter fabarum TaxID=483199 RepID=UPI0014049044|nr:DUF4880 domain-containing protein [Acetobacter fabarum]NHO41218.1 DUF4880 domain-containing protein [Acetobacter fabarum]